MPEGATCPLPVPHSAIVPRLERRDVLAYSWPQSEDPMAKIKHIAIATQDPEGTARFYTDVFGMKQIGRIDSPNVLGYFLSDGDINFAILKFKSDAAGEDGARTGAASITSAPGGELEAIAERLAQAGSHRRDDINDALGLGQSGQRHGNVEVKYTAPDGVTVDVSETGWVGTPTFNPR